MARSGGILRARGQKRKWRLGPESNRGPRLCRPLHNHSATQPVDTVRCPMEKNPGLPGRGSRCTGRRKVWSGKRDSNSRPQPWQGCALPTELFPRRTRPHIVGMQPGLSIPARFSDRPGARAWARRPLSRYPWTTRSEWPPHTGRSRPVPAWAAGPRVRDRAAAPARSSVPWS